SSSTTRFVRMARSSPGPSPASRSLVRMARFRHWLEIRARRAAPNMHSLGAPVSSRFKFDGAKFWSMCVSTNMCITSALGVWVWRLGPERPRPPALHGPPLRVPIDEVLQQLRPADRDLPCPQQSDRGTQAVRQLILVADQEDGETTLHALGDAPVRVPELGERGPEVGRHAVLGLRRTWMPGEKRGHQEVAGVSPRALL